MISSNSQLTSSTSQPVKNDSEEDHIVAAAHVNGVDLDEVDPCLHLLKAHKHHSAFLEKTIHNGINTQEKSEIKDIIEKVNYEISRTRENATTDCLQPTPNFDWTDYEDDELTFDQDLGNQVQVLRGGDDSADPESSIQDPSDVDDSVLGSEDLENSVQVLRGGDNSTDLGSPIQAPSNGDDSVLWPSHIDFQRTPGPPQKEIKQSSLETERYIKGLKIMMEYHNDGTEKVGNYPDSETKDTQIEMDYDDINVERPGNYFDNEIEGNKTEMDVDKVHLPSKCDSNQRRLSPNYENHELTNTEALKSVPTSSQTLPIAAIVDKEPLLGRGKFAEDIIEKIVKAPSELLKTDSKNNNGDIFQSENLANLKANKNPARMASETSTQLNLDPPHIKQCFPERMTSSSQNMANPKNEKNELKPKLAYSPPTFQNSRDEYLVSSFASPPFSVSFLFSNQLESVGFPS